VPKSKIAANGDYNLSGLRFNPLIKAQGLRLSACGKNKMLIVGVAMRKLLHLVYSVLKSQQPFDENFCVKSA
jgi:hypothetical protein